MIYHRHETQKKKLHVLEADIIKKNKKQYIDLITSSKNAFL